MIYLCSNRHLLLQNIQKMLQGGIVRDNLLQQKKDALHYQEKNVEMLDYNGINETKKIKEKGVRKGYIEGGLQCFLLESQDNMQFDYHYHTFHKCLYIMSGELNYTIEGHDFMLSDGDLIWVPAYEAHKLEVSEHKAYKRLVLYISQDYINHISSEAGNILKLIGNNYTYVLKNISQSMNLYTEKLFENTSVLISHLQEVSYHHEVKDAFADRGIHGESIRRMNNQFYLNSLFCAWLHTYLEALLHRIHEKKQNGDIQNKEITKIIDYIKNNLDKQLSVDSIADYIHMSKYHLMRKFKETIGMSIHQYVIHERLRKSRSLMKEGYALTDISYMVGFPDYTSFARAFKKMYLCSPKKFSKLDPTTFYE